MQIVIDIPEKTLNEIKDNAMFAGTIPSEILWDVTSAIVNSTPLPKGHGRLIDADSLFSWFDGENRAKYPIKDGKQYDTMMFYEIFDEIDNAPTIIEGTEGKE